MSLLIVGAISGCIGEAATSDPTSLPGPDTAAQGTGDSADDPSKSDLGPPVWWNETFELVVSGANTPVGVFGLPDEVFGDSPNCVRLESQHAEVLRLHAEASWAPVVPVLDELSLGVWTPGGDQQGVEGRSPLAFDALPFGIEEEDHALVYVFASHAKMLAVKQPFELVVALQYRGEVEHELRECGVG